MPVQPDHMFMKGRVDVAVKEKMEVASLAASPLAHTQGSSNCHRMIPCSLPWLPKENKNENKKYEECKSRALLGIPKKNEDYLT